MPAEVVLDFDATTNSLGALNAAAYRLLGLATCKIDRDGERFVCRLNVSSPSDADDVRDQFLQLVTDENVREALRARTEPVRNLILSLAFGSLATQDK